jgi:hypothetical protein
MDSKTPHELDAQLGKGWEQKLEKLYEGGAFDSEVAKALNCTMSFFDNAYRSYPLFAEHVKRGRTLAKAFYEGIARNNILKSDGTLNYNVWRDIMKWRFGMTDKGEDESRGISASSASKDEIEQEFRDPKIRDALLHLLSQTSDD